MQGLLPFIFLLATVAAFFLNLLGFMRLLPLYFTLPLLFITIYLTIFSFVYRHAFKGFSRMRSRRW
ncbi:hypothetical protein [Sediminibacillus halophilus]|uniref:Uncharacterized protein n=1 Tax=Sediminibacillus halophilus TaxID=482461 RepID=A0A1G9PI93_9BACI|nr:MULTISPECIES: hypothetical protein [Sediminibacillus]SDL97917.1 hypothetical protein SAMN05216244_1423 [Sediminibacillus halophilus]